MITLRNKLYESLLDDEEDLVNDDISVLLNDESFEFYDYFWIQDDFGKYIKEIPTINKNNLIIKNHLNISEEHEPLSSYIPNIKSITANTITIMCDEEDSDTLCKNLKTNRLKITAGDNTILKDINLTILNKSSDYSDIYIKSDDRCNPVIFDNMNIKSLGNKDIHIYSFGGFYLPKFINTKFNCKNVSFSISNSHMDKNKSIIDNINACLDMNYSVNVTNLKTKEIKRRTKLTIKNIRPLVGNLINKVDKPITKFKDGVKITDIFKDIPANTNNIHIKLSNAEIVFNKTGELLGNFKIKEFLIPLSDGWFMQMYSRVVVNAKYIGKYNWGSDIRK